MKRLAALTLAAALLLCACGPSSYSDIHPHLDSSTITHEHNGELRASNYTELRGAILHFVEAGLEEGTVTLAGYDGNAENDLRTACSEVTNDEPLGAYGVEYMSYNCVRVLANYEASVSITYSRSREELDRIKSVSRAADFRAELLSTLREFGSELTAEVSYYVEESYDAAKIVAEYMESDPFVSLGSPSIEVNVYPSSGLSRIIEVKFTYPYPVETLRARQTALEDAIGGMLASASVEEDGAAETVRGLVRALCERCEFVDEPEYDDYDTEGAGDVRNAYGALVDGAAASEGYALALSALCGELGIETRRVDGRWNGAEHSWNLVELDGLWYHVDASLCDYYANESFLFGTDAEAEGELKWSPQGLPQTAEEPYSWEIEPIFSEGGGGIEIDG